MRVKLHTAYFVLVAISLLSFGVFLSFMSSDTQEANERLGVVDSELVDGLKDGSIVRSGKDLAPLLSALIEYQNSATKSFEKVNSAKESIGAFLLGIGVLQVMALFQLNSWAKREGSNKSTQPTQ